MIILNIGPMLERQGWSRYRLALELGVPHSTVHKLFDADKKAIYFDLLADLCEKLNCTPGDLLEYKPTPKQDRPVKKKAKTNGRGKA